MQRTVSTGLDVLSNGLSISYRQNEIVFLQSRITELSVELDVRQREYTELLKFNQKLEDHNTVFSVFFWFWDSNRDIWEQVLLRDLETSQDICRQRDVEIKV